MTKLQAIDVLIAVACCSTPELCCNDCPRNELDNEFCVGWGEHEVADAVKVLRGVEA